MIVAAREIRAFSARFRRGGRLAACLHGGMRDPHATAAADITAAIRCDAAAIVGECCGSPGRQWIYGTQVIDLAASLTRLANRFIGREPDLRGLAASYAILGDRNYVILYFHTTDDAIGKSCIFSGKIMRMREILSDAMTDAPRSLAERRITRSGNPDLFRFLRALVVGAIYACDRQSVGPTCAHWPCAHAPLSAFEPGALPQDSSPIQMRCVITQITIGPHRTDGIAGTCTVVAEAVSGIEIEQVRMTVEQAPVLTNARLERRPVTLAVTRYRRRLGGVAAPAKIEAISHVGRKSEQGRRGGRRRREEGGLNF